MRQAGYACLTSMIILFIAGCQSRENDVVAYGQFARQSRSLPAGRPGNTATVQAAAGDDLPELTADSTVQDYLAYAALNNPGLEAAFNRFKAATEQIPQATALPDPRFTYRYYIEQVETRVGAQEQSFGISQMFPWFGKLKLSGRAAENAALAAKQQYEAAKWDLFFRLQDAYYEYYYLSQAIESVRENIQLLQNFERVVRTRYRAATAEHPDLIRAQVELGKLEDRLKTLQELREPVAARLNAALNRSPDAPIAPLENIPALNVIFSDEQILKMMADSNPRLAALRYDIARRRTEVELAQKDYYPDVTLGLDFIDTSDRIGPNPPGDSGQDPVIAMVSLNLPIWKEKLEAGVRQARYRHRAAVNDETQTLNSLTARVKMVLYQFRDAERKIVLYRDILLPKAIESVKANEASFRSGQSTFLEVIDAQRVLLEFELAYERALASKAQKLAELEMLVGANLPHSVSNDLMPSPVQENQETVND